MLTVFASLMAVAGLFLAGLAAVVGRRQQVMAGFSLAVLLASVAWWGFAYAIELSVSELTVRLRWGDLKYVGICVLPPAWLVFVLQYTGRANRVTRRLLALLALEPVALLTLLAVPATHDLIRYYPASERGEDLPVVATGPVFWLHFTIANLLLLSATGLFVATMLRLSRTYRRMALVMVAAALLPWAVNLLHNFEVGWFTQLDLTPFAFTVTGGVLVWGLHRNRLVNLFPLARGVIVDTMTDAVFVLDAFGRIADVNPAGATLLDRRREDVLGLPLDECLPGRWDAGHGDPTRSELVSGDRRTFDARRQPLTDGSGRAAGELVVLRDITERIEAENQLRELLTERSRIAATLQASVVPGHLPAISMTEVATRYEPAGDGHEVGGDFFDIFPLADSCWGVVLGDVSGKGSEAAAVTALTRYTLRTLANPRHPPSRTLRELNTRLLATTVEECHCTLIYAIARTTVTGIDLTLSLAGHHPPLVLRRNGTVEPAGELGTLLGLLEDASFVDTPIHLGTGDLICMFTDGLIEARHGNELFGTERVASLLQELCAQETDDVAGELVRAARQFQGAALSDDLALLIIRAQADQVRLDRTFDNAQGCPG